MERRKLFVMGLAVLITQRSIAQEWNRIPGGNIIGTTEWLGADVGSTVPLRIETRVNQPIDWYTNAIPRIRLNPAVNGPIGAFPGIDRDGFLLLSGVTQAFTNVNSRAPFTRLHLIDQAGSGPNENVFAQVLGFRNWQRNGITFTGNSDQSYIGHKYAGDDNTDFVIQWSDNQNGSPWGVDRMKFVFTTSHNAGAVRGAQTTDGLEAMRFWPEDLFNVNVGIGDFAPAAVGDPTERLDILTGRLRIRDLPTAPEADNLTQFVVVDPNGVLGWRNVPTNPGTGTACDWNILNPLANSAVAVHHLFTGVGTSNTCPDANDHVGIGTNASNMPGKLTVAETASTTAAEHGVHVTMNADNQASNGMFVQARPATGVSGTTIRGIQVTAENGEATTEGINVVANYNGSVGLGELAFAARCTTNVDAALDEGVGVQGRVEVSAACDNAFGLHGSVQNPSTAALDDSYAVFGRVEGNSLRSYGVKGESILTSTEGTSGLQRFGVHGSVGGFMTPFNCGVFGSAPVVIAEDATNPGAVGSWAGYFQGRVRISNNAYVNGNVLVTSDERLKSNLKKLSGSLERITSLTPLSYEFIRKEHPHMQLPSGRQIGLAAQNVREVFPDLVEEVPVPAVYDSTGAQMIPATSHLAVNYIGLIPVLIGAVQEQQAQVAAEQATNTALTDRLAEQEARMAEQARRLDQLEAALASCCANPTNGDTRLLSTPPAEGSDDLNKALEGDARHLHIQPNPFTERTTLHYRLERAGRMQLLANSADGKSLKVLQDAALEAGAYQFNWETADLTPGVYYVTLLLDGEPLVKKAVKVMR